MATVTAAQVYQAALASGFSKAESVIMTVTAELENSYRTDTTTGNGGGLLQFEPGTWSGTGVSCDKGSLSCQMAAARKLTRGGFVPSWLQNWLTPELQQGHMTVSDYAAKVSGVEQSLGIGSSGASSLLSSAAGATSTSGGGIPVVGGVVSGVTGVVSGAAGGVEGAAQSVFGIPGQVGHAVSSVWDFATDPVGTIKRALVGGLSDIGGRILPYIIILTGMVIVFWLLMRQLAEHQGTAGTENKGSAGKENKGSAGTENESSSQESKAVSE